MNRENINFNSTQHQTNINKRIMERENYFNQNSKNNNQTSRNNFDSIDSLENTNIGEITGFQMNLEELDKGMPLRTIISETDEDKYQTQKDKLSSTNPYLDFDLFHNKPNLKVSYYDHCNNAKFNLKYSTIDSDNTILNQYNSKNNEINLSNEINNFTFNFRFQFSDNLKIKKPFILSPFNIFQVFSILYIGSKNKTEEELRQYFSFPDKNNTFKSLYKINFDLSNTKIFYKMNLVCMPDFIMLNDAYLSYIDKLCHFVKFNPNDPISESNKINNLVCQSTNNMIKNIIRPNMLTKKNVLTIISTVFFYSKWKESFNPSFTKLETFFGISKILVNMMTQSNKKHRYFEDNENQILEMDYFDEYFCMGFVLPKNNYTEPIITFDKFKYYISFLNEQTIKILKIPKFKHETRYKIDNLFKKYGLKEIFINADISEIIPPINELPRRSLAPPGKTWASYTCADFISKNGVLSDELPIYITDIIHSSIIIVDESGTKASASTSINTQFGQNIKSNSEINFIANHQFLYYIRFKPYNTLIFIGQYY